MTTREYKINRISKQGYKVTYLGKNIKAEKDKESYHGTLNAVYNKIFPETIEQLINRLENELSVSKQYAKGLEEILYKRCYSKQ